MHTGRKSKLLGYKKTGFYKMPFSYQRRNTTKLSLGAYSKINSNHQDIEVYTSASLPKRGLCLTLNDFQSVIPWLDLVLSLQFLALMKAWLDLLLANVHFPAEMVVGLGRE